MDLSVFRDAGYALTAGLPLYSEDFPSSSGFRFIYPPFAAVLFLPMAALAPLVLQVVWSALNLALVWWCARLVLIRLAVPRPVWTAVALMGPILLLEPVRSNFAFGQINLVLMALVLADLLGATPRRWHGVGIGIAAAIKLTPAAFGLVLLLRRDLPSAARAAGAFLAAAGIGFAVAPKDSVYFWVTEFFNTERAGGHAFSRNQAVTGLLARLGADGAVKDTVWLAAAAVIIAAAAWAGYRFTRVGEHVAAVSVLALAVLLAVPFAVTHHWAYSVLLLPLLVAPQYRSWRPLLALATVIFLIGPHTLLPEPGAGGAEAAVRQLLGNAQVLVALVLLVAAVLAARTRTRVTAAAPTSSPVPAGSTV
nr:glycosyltransferase family 87 protein [Rhodococcus pyridinivorans]